MSRQSVRVRDLLPGDVLSQLEDVLTFAGFALGEPGTYDNVCRAQRALARVSEAVAAAQVAASDAEPHAVGVTVVSGQERG